MSSVINSIDAHGGRVTATLTQRLFDAYSGETEDCIEAYSFTGTGRTFQISLAYSRMARSEENRPMRATLSIDMRVQCSELRY